MSTYRAYEVAEIDEKTYQGRIVEKHTDDLPEGDVLVRVAYSSLNFKDALSANGNRGVTRVYPHVPGIDAVGEVVAATSSSLAAGDSVIVSGYDLGMNTAGGFGQYIRVPAAWVMPLPAGITALESMQLGTAGFTAALCVEKLLAQGLDTSDGEVLVTGATGGVGIVAVLLLAKLGFNVVASTGKPASHELLTEAGARSIMDRNELLTASPKPLSKERWAGAVDVVGGDTLFNVVKSLRYGASVAACGLVQSPVFQASVLPFILRGVNLLGVDSVVLPLEQKQSTWSKLAGDWKLDKLDSVTRQISLSALDESLRNVLGGGAVGRYVLDLTA